MHLFSLDRSPFKSLVVSRCIRFAAKFSSAPKVSANFARLRSLGIRATCMNKFRAAKAAKYHSKIPSLSAQLATNTRIANVTPNGQKGNYIDDYLGG